MMKCLCDMCCKNQANHEFKVKRLLPDVVAEMHVMRWIKIDICDACYYKLIHAKEDTDDQE